MGETVQVRNGSWRYGGKRYLFLRYEYHALRPTQRRAQSSVEAENRAKLAKAEARYAKACAKASKSGGAIPKRSPTHEKLAAKVAAYDAAAGGGKSRAGRAQSRASESASAKGQGRWPAANILDEMARAEDNAGAWLHLAERGRMEPVLLEGKPPREIQRQLEAEHAVAREADGDALRGNAAVLGTVVASYPVPLVDLCEEMGRSRESFAQFIASPWVPADGEREDIPEEWKAAKGWLWDSVEWVKADTTDERGVCHAESFVAHLEEGFLHFHAACPARVDEQGRMSLADWFRPVKAQQSLRRERGGDPGQKAMDDAWKEACRDALDQYQVEVCERYDMARKSDSPRARLSNSLYRAQQEQIQELRRQAALARQAEQAVMAQALEIVAAKGEASEARVQLERARAEQKRASDELLEWARREEEARRLAEQRAEQWRVEAEAAAKRYRDSEAKAAAEAKARKEAEQREAEAKASAEHFESEAAGWKRAYYELRDEMAAAISGLRDRAVAWIKAAIDPIRNRREFLAVRDGVVPKGKDAVPEALKGELFRAVLDKATPPAGGGGGGWTGTVQSTARPAPRPVKPKPWVPPGQRGYGRERGDD